VSRLARRAPGRVRTDFTPRGEQVRDELAAFLDKLKKDVLKFEEQRDRALAREAQKRER
jgi:acyl-[acyl-carrier-protein] desaturase